MKVITKVLTTGAVFLLLTSTVGAAGWHEVGKVTRVHSGHGGLSMYFTTRIQISNPTCPVNSGYTFSANATNTDRMYSLILSAYISKKPISIFVTGTCLAGRPMVNAVQLKDVGVAH